MSGCKVIVPIGTHSQYVISDCAILNTKHTWQSRASAAIEIYTDILAYICVIICIQTQQLIYNVHRWCWFSCMTTFTSYMKIKIKFQFIYVWLCTWSNAIWKYSAHVVYVSEINYTLSFSLTDIQLQRPRGVGSWVVSPGCSASSWTSQPCSVELDSGSWPGCSASSWTSQPCSVELDPGLWAPDVVHHPERLSHVQWSWILGCEPRM